MNSIRNLKYILAALALVSLATAGCSKDEKKKGEEAAKAGDTAKTAAAPAAPASTTGFKLFPQESNVIVGVSFAKITTSKLFQTMLMPLITEKAGSELEKVKTTCNVDPLAAIESVILGGQAASENSFVFVIRGINGELISKCGPALAEANGKKVEVTQEGNLTKITEGGGESMYLGWADPSTVVISPQGEDKAKMEALMASTSGVDANGEMMDLLRNVDTNAAIWFVVKEPPMPMPVPMQIKAAFGSIDLKDGLKLDIGVRQSSAAEASNTVEMANSKLAEAKASPMGKYISNLQLKANNADVIAQLSMSDAELQELIKMLAPQVMNMTKMFGL